MTDEKCESAEPQEELTMKQQISQLDEQKKKAFYKYTKWKYSLYNEKNITSKTQFKLMERHFKEYQACSMMQEVSDKPPTAAIKKTQSKPRIQSAKSGVSRQRNY